MSSVHGLEQDRISFNKDTANRHDMAFDIHYRL